VEGLTLAGRVALVTGGGSGIGAQIVQDLGDLGATVLVAGRNEARAKEAHAITTGSAISDAMRTARAAHPCAAARSPKFASYEKLRPRAMKTASAGSDWR